MFIETCAQILRRRMPRGIARGDGHIDRRQQMLIQAKRLARNALDAVACNGAAESAGGDCEPQARVSFMVGQHG